MDKRVAGPDEAIRELRDGSTILVGGFGLCGVPENLIAALHRRGTRDLAIIYNNCGIDDKGLGILLANGQVRKITASYVGENKLLEEKVIRGELDLTLVPQGTLAERIRAGGAGIPAFYTPAGVGTLVAEGKETRTFDGNPYLLERWLKADFALVKAWKGDIHGNLVYRDSARNFNPLAAFAPEARTAAPVEA